MISGEYACEGAPWKWLNEWSTGDAWVVMNEPSSRAAIRDERSAGFTSGQVLARGLLRFPSRTALVSSDAREGREGGRKHRKATTRLLEQ